MAKNKSFSKLIASLEDQDGTAQVVDATNPSADLKDQVETPESDAVQTGEQQETDDQVQADMKDFTAIDKASYAQGEKIHRLEEAAAATEAYVSILKSSLAQRQGLDGATATVMRQDLNAQYPKFFAPLTAALEAISNEEEAIGYSSSSKELATTQEAAKEGEGRLAKLKSAIAAAIKKFVDFMKRTYERLKEYYAKAKEAITGSKAKATELKGVIKALPNPGQPVKSVPSLGAGTKAGQALQQLAESKEPAPEPASEITIEPTNLLMDDGKLNLSDSANMLEALDFYVKYCNQVKPAVDKSLAKLKEMMANPRDKVFDNEADDGAITEIIGSTVGSVQLPTFDFGGRKFVEGERGPGFWRLEGERGTSEGSSQTIPLPSREETAKWDDSILQVMDAFDDANVASAAANEALKEYGDWMDENKDKFKINISPWILFPTHTRDNLWPLPNHIQGILQQRLFAIDQCVRARLRSNKSPGLESVDGGDTRLGKLKGAVADGWKRFIAWLKEKFSKLKELFTKIFGRTKKVKEANAKLLASPTPETAKEVASMLGAKPNEEEKTTPPVDKPASTVDRRMSVTVSGIGVLSGKDPMDMKKQNLAAMKDIYENWMKPTETSVKEVLRILVGDETKLAQAIDMNQVAQEIIKVEFTPVKASLPNGYVIEGTENKWGFKLTQPSQPETITEVEIFGPAAIKTLLATNDASLDIALKMGETWNQITATVDKISAETKFLLNAGNGAEMKKWITEYLTTITNSDIVPLSKLMIQATTARLLLFTEMAAPQ